MRQALLLTVVAAALAGCTPRSDEADIQVVGPSNLDLGRHPVSESRTASFELVNRGRATARILSIRKGGPGAWVWCDPMELAAGGRATVKVVIPPDSGSGAYAENIFIETSGTRRRFVCLRVTGKVVPLMQVDPTEHLYVDHMPTNQTWTQAFRLNATHPDITLGEPTHNATHPTSVALSHTPGGRPGQYTLDVVVPPVVAPGSYECGIQIPVVSPAGQSPVVVAITGTIGAERGAANPPPATATGAPPAPPVRIDYFYATGCQDCRRVNAQVLPRLIEQYREAVRVVQHDVGEPTNMALLVTFQEKLHITENRPVCMVIDYSDVLNGFDVIKTDLLGRVGEALSGRQAAGWTSPREIVVDDRCLAATEQRMDRFTLPVVLLAGLTDGINPCAMSSLVLLMSLLIVTGAGRRGILAMGLSFCLASFVTYTALGLGLMEGLRLLGGFPHARTGLDIILTGLLVFLACLSFRDAWAYAQTRDPKSVALQLPERIKSRIRDSMELGLGMRSWVLGGLVAGAVMTLLESVCTGQMYLPTLALMARQGSGHAWGYLLGYNAMFILPLVAVFVVTYAGVRTPVLLEWSRRNVVVSKVLMGLLFLMLALVLWRPT